MSELDLSQVEEVPVNALPFHIPPVETMIRQAAINVMKGKGENGNNITVMQFITPVMIYSVQLDDNAATSLSDEIRPSGLVRATAADLRKVG